MAICTAERTFQKSETPGDSVRLCQQDSGSGYSASIPPERPNQQPPGFNSPSRGSESSSSTLGEKECQWLDLPWRAVLVRT